jgi:beta-galactosidase
VRTGFKTPDNLVTDQPLPGVFKELVGAEVRHWQSLPPGVTYTFTTEIPGLAGSAGAWAETLEVLTSSEHTRILARYEDGPFRGLAAMTGRMEGQGKVYYLGWLPDDDQTGALLTWLAGQCEIPIQESLPSGVILTQRGHYTIIANFNDHSVSVTTGLDQMEIAGRDVVVVSLET